MEYLFHIPNGGHRNKATAGKLKAEGVKPGVPDLCLPVARGKYHGLYIEMKRLHGGKLSDSQRIWLERLNKEGYLAVVCNGWVEASVRISGYLEGCG